MKKFMYSRGGKAFLVILCVLTMITSVLSFIACYFLYDNDFYMLSKNEIRERIMKSYAIDYCRDIYETYKHDPVSLDFGYNYSNFYYTLTKKDGEVIASNYNGEATSYTVTVQFNNKYIVKGYIPADFKYKDELATADFWINVGYQWRWAVVTIGIISVIINIFSYSLLIAGAGRHNDDGGETVHTGIIERIPFDILSCLVALVLVVLVDMLDRYSYGVEEANISFGAFSFFLYIIFIGYTTTFAIRIKNHTLISELFIIRVCRKLLGLIKATGKLIMKFVEGITIYWKIILTTLLIGILNSFIMILVYASAAALLLYMLFWCAVILAVCYIASVLKKLQIAGERLAAGDLTYHVDTSRMIWDFKRHGENLNSISAGMSRAVDERVKSERFKTELITNVSHDIKTPLTSIINYIDLLGKEEEKLRGTPCENTKIREYTQVIARQSARLKKLTEDLIEASKASTGNITVTLEKSDLNVLLSQAMGEYGERFENYGLDMIVRMPNEPVYIMADGRHLFRVFDNLMNNIIKYAMPGTRVYLTLENKDGRALIIFRNISKYALDLAPDELTERFVRGDLSRNSEGSGLGLSIAKSLTELQGGQFKIDTDADLFKVTLSFPVISGE